MRTSSFAADRWAELKRNNRPAQITEQLILQHLKGGAE